jgi:hypothetical protein
MAHRRSGRAGRLVQVEHALLSGNQACVGGDELRHGRPTEDAPALAGGSELASGTDNRRRDVLRRPLFDLTKRP